jgi:hypothetical protein
LEVTRSRSSVTGSSDCCASCAAPVKVAMASCLPCSALSPFPRRLLHRFDEVEHIGRAAARHRRHRIDLGFIVQPHGLADGAQDIVSRLRCAALTPAVATMPVMPMPISAGVFGMQRTMAP